eukprot:3837828-Prorocentrum_lima.AAC.1
MDMLQCLFSISKFCLRQLLLIRKVLLYHKNVRCSGAELRFAQRLVKKLQYADVHFCIRPGVA